MENIANATSRNDHLNNNIKQDYDLATKFEDSGGLTDRAIDIITRNCWPAMLTSLGFTAEEGNILRGYCDASSAPSPGGLAVIYQPQVSKVGHLGEAYEEWVHQPIVGKDSPRFFANGFMELWNLIDVLTKPFITPALYGGILLGYVMYDVTHYYTHHGKPSKGIILRLKRFHMNHHFRIRDKGFGISSSLWDIVFGTLPPAKAAKA
ncbi:Aldehyde oxygenase (deformylating) [Citrus sinensis]|nr:Aldehyde oxygenase (deformylating) [Citrus sinensis]